MVTCGTLTVEEPFDPAAVEVTGCSGAFPLTLAPGASRTIQIPLANPNDVEATGQVVVRTASGRELTRETAVISSGGETYFASIRAPQTPGTSYDVEAVVENVSQGATGDVAGVAAADGGRGSRSGRRGGLRLSNSNCRTCG